MAKNQQTNKIFDIFFLGERTGKGVTARNEEEAILVAQEVYGRIGGCKDWMFPDVLTAREVPKPSEADESSVEKEDSEALPLICQYTHQFCQREKKPCLYQKEIQKAKTGHEMRTLARACPHKGQTMSKDEYQDQSRERVKEAARKWDYKIWWRA